ncbi:hypothetical protein Drorol1_Dr00000139, partial [Drosera rotundifolia]
MGRESWATIWSAAERIREEGGGSAGRRRRGEGEEKEKGERGRRRKRIGEQRGWLAAAAPASLSLGRHRPQLHLHWPPPNSPSLASSDPPSPTAPLNLQTPLFSFAKPRPGTQATSPGSGRRRRALKPPRQARGLMESKESRRGRKGLRWKRYITPGNRAAPDSHSFVGH